MELVINFLQNTFGLSRDYAFLSVGILIGFILVAFSKPKAKNETIRGVNNHIKSSISFSTDLEPKQFFDSKTNAINTTSATRNIISMNGNKLNIDDETIENIRKLLQNNDKIQAIKIIREKTGLGLAEAKTLVETLESITRVS